MWSTRSLIVSFALFAFAGCADEPIVVRPPNVNVEVVVPADEPTETTEPDDDVIYYVADADGVVHETDTRLEYVDGYTYTIDAWPEMDCIVATFRVPEDAGQGVIIANIDFGAYGYDANGTRWMDGVDSGGAGHEMLLWSAFSIFRNTENLQGARGYWPDEIDSIYNDWANLFGCWSNCDSKAFDLQAEYYVPPGEVALGFCSHWQNGAATGADYGDPAETDYMTAVLSKVEWMPADTQDFRSPNVDGLSLPVSSAFFPYQLPW